MSTPARLLRNKENVIAGDPTIGAQRTKARLFIEPAAGLVDSSRKALGNVGNSGKQHKSVSDSCEEEKLFLVPPTPRSAQAKLVSAKPEIVEAEEDYPEIEIMPTSFNDEDDYEDIWPKACRFTSQELTQLARWHPVHPGLNDCIFESSPHKVIKYEPMPDYFHNSESFSILDNDSMAYVPPLSPVS